MDQKLNVAVLVAELALKEAENAKQEYLIGIATRKMVIIPVNELRELAEAGWAELQRRGYIRS